MVFEAYIFTPLAKLVSDIFCGIMLIDINKSNRDVIGTTCAIWDQKPQVSLWVLRMLHDLDRKCNVWAVIAQHHKLCILCNWELVLDVIQDVVRQGCRCNHHNNMRRNMCSKNSKFSIIRTDASTPKANTVSLIDADCMNVVCEFSLG